MHYLTMHVHVILLLYFSIETKKRKILHCNWNSFSGYIDCSFPSNLVLRNTATDMVNNKVGSQISYIAVCS